MVKHKVGIIGNFNEFSFEGFVKLVTKIQKKLGVEKVQPHLAQNKYLSKYSLLNIHSAGIWESIKYHKMQKSTIYSLHSNIHLGMFKELKIIDKIENIYLTNKVIYIITEIGWLKWLQERLVYLFLFL